ncbi:MAG: hypothetical protein WA066_03065 [Candidatus Omnitrophota bacterium]
MAKLSRKKGITSQILHIFIQDSSSTTGAGLTALVYNSASLACRYINAGGTLSGAITLEDITTLGTYQAPTLNTNMRFKEVSSVSPSQGIYEIHIHNDWMNLSGGSLVIMLAGAANMAQLRLEIDLQADVNVTQLLGTAWLTPAVAGTPDVNVKTETDHDLTATQKTSVTAAVPSVVQIQTGLATPTNITAGTITSVTAGVTVTTNNDKTGYGLSATAIQAIWDALTSALTTVGSIGKKLADWIVGTIDTYTGNTKQTGDAYAQFNAAFTDATSLTANSLPDRIRTTMWMLRNKMTVTDANGNTVLYKDDSVTQAISVLACLTDDSTTTTRLRLA